MSHPCSRVHFKYKHRQQATEKHDTHSSIDKLIILTTKNPQRIMQDDETMICSSDDLVMAAGTKVFSNCVVLHFYKPSSRKKKQEDKGCESSSKIKPAKPRISLVYGDVGSAVAPLKYQPLRPFNNVTG